MGVIRGRNESLGDGARGSASKQQIDKYNRVIHYGRVFKVSDDGNMKLKVFIRGVDEPDINAEDLPWCEPFLPRMFNVCPKVGEAVKIILMDTKNPNQQREWVGPIISQPEKIKEDPFFFTALAGKVGGLMKLGRSVKTIAEADGIYPKDDDVALLGRDNSDIILREREALIRVGVHEIDNPLKLNEKNPAYINMRLLKPSDLEKKENQNQTEKDLNLSEDRTDTVIVSNKIFLIGRDSNSKVIKPILTTEDHLKLEDDLHPVVYGDVLKEFLVILRSWIKSHIHPYHGLPTDPSGDTVRLEEWFIKNLDDRLLSRNIYVGGDVPTENTGNNSIA
jgi:hypothetical protein